MEFNYDQINIKLIKIMFAYKQVCLNKKSEILVNTERKVAP